jgi:hypothetical protein
MQAFTSVPKRKVFVSYHHKQDQLYANEFRQFFCHQVEVFTDNSLERALDSDDDIYVRWAIKQNNIKGSSCTVVLCGPETRWRKYVDWEIKTTLDLRHGLFGIWLPNNPEIEGGVHKPDRLQDNIDSGFSEFIPWADCTVSNLQQVIERAVSRSSLLVNNDRPLRQRNG